METKMVRLLLVRKGTGGQVIEQILTSGTDPTDPARVEEYLKQYPNTEITKIEV